MCWVDLDATELTSDNWSTYKNVFFSTAVSLLKLDQLFIVKRGLDVQLSDGAPSST